MLTLPNNIQEACSPLFEKMPLETAMEKLVGSNPKHVDLVDTILSDPALKDRSDLAAGLWLYVDDLERSHTLSQSIDGATGAYWHGIMHRREGDFYNSHYWMQRATSHALRASRPDLDPDSLIDAVKAARGKDEIAVVERQRAEWKALFEWCAAQPSP